LILLSLPLLAADNGLQCLSLPKRPEVGQHKVLDVVLSHGVKGSLMSMQSAAAGVHGLDVFQGPEVPLAAAPDESVR
jgi:hypothetical protein